MKLCSHQPLSHSYPNTAVRINPKKNTCCYFIVPPVTSILQKMARIQYLVKHFSNTVQHYCEKIYFNKVINKSQQNHCCQNYQLLGFFNFHLETLYKSNLCTQNSMANVSAYFFLSGKMFCYLSFKSLSIIWYDYHLSFYHKHLYEVFLSSSIK